MCQPYRIIIIIKRTELMRRVKIKRPIELQTDCRRTEKSLTGPLMKGTWDNSTEGVYLALNSPNTQFVGEKLVCSM